MTVSEGLLAASRGNLCEARSMMIRWSYSEHAKLAPNPAPGLWLTGMARALMNRARPGVLATDLAACNQYEEGLERAMAVRCPALLVSGGRDRMTPVRAAGALQQALPRMKTVTLAGAGHAMMQEQPDALLDALVRFLSPLARASTPSG